MASHLQETAVCLRSRAELMMHDLEPIEGLGAEPRTRSRIGSSFYILGDQRIVLRTGENLHSSHLPASLTESPTRTHRTRTASCTMPVAAERLRPLKPKLQSREPQPQQGQPSARGLRDIPITGGSLPPDCNPFHETTQRPRSGRANPGHSHRKSTPVSSERRALTLVNTVNSSWSDDDSSNGDTPAQEDRSSKSGTNAGSARSHEKSDINDSIQMDHQDVNMAKANASFSLNKFHVYAPGSRDHQQHISMSGSSISGDGFAYSAGRFISEALWRGPHCYDGTGTRQNSGRDDDANRG